LHDPEYRKLDRLRQAAQVRVYFELQVDVAALGLFLDKKDLDAAAVRQVAEDTLES
jgi:hypothetical protein